jgi:hypothetical protein
MKFLDFSKDFENRQNFGGVNVGGGGVVGRLSGEPF